MRTDNTLQQMTGKSGMESLQEQQLAELVRLGRMYLKEHGASQEQSAAYIDAVKAAEEDLRAARKGNAEAAERLGIRYQRGDGVEQDYAEALKWFSAAAEKGNAGAEYSLGFMYENGLGAVTDLAAAVSFYKKAAAHGSARAERSLGRLYEGGLGVTQDFAEAVKWYSRAAADGDAEGAYRLGLRYEAGDGGPADYAEAARWFMKAALQDHAGRRTASATFTRPGGASRRAIQRP